jgi:Patatin-like phospholipase
MATNTVNPGKTRSMDIPSRVVIGQAVVAELNDIEQRRGEGPSQLDPENWIRHCLDKNLFGICISGGGIRSATYGLGVLQGLAEKGLLSLADYISTVSGGGYVGAWLQGVAYHDPANYQKILDPKREPGPSSKDPITFLRKYSNYLAPRNGLSLDALVIPLIWFRNMMLNQVIIISALMAIYIVLLAPGALLHQIATDAISFPSRALLILAGLFTLVAVLKIGGNLRRIVKREFAPADEAKAMGGKVANEHVARWVAVPVFISALLVVLALTEKFLDPKTIFGEVLPLGFLGLYILVALLQWRGGFVDCYIDQRKLTKDPLHPAIAWLHVLWMSFFTTILLLVMFTGISFLTADWDPTTALGSHLVMAWAPPLYILALIIGIGLHIGLMGRDFPDASREWLARLAALLVTFIGIWAALFALAVFAPLGIAKLIILGKNWWLASGTSAWVLSTIASVLAGKSGKSGNPGNAPQPEQKSTTLDLVARFGPFIAIPGFLALVAFGTQLLLHPVPWTARGTFLENFVDNYWTALPFGSFSWRFPLVLLVFLVFLFVVLSRRVNINEFSMHHFYKNRLVRCYLGASATKTRMRDPFTGFDPKDDIPLFKLRFQTGDKKRERVPYPIVNAALNVTAGSELATQERKALPWFFTPHYSGFFPARSEEDRVAADPDSRPSYANSQLSGKGLALGTAMGISGAAANPNMGYHSSAQTAFLLTLFNVRLGWWLGNPTKAKAYDKAGPIFALGWLFRELFGFVDESSNYLNLSDGGHFENLGIYELVRRRCRYIIAIDGEADTDYRFESLGGAVRKCRTDFGIEIKIDPKPITPVPPALSRAHCIVGTINYGKNANGDLETGCLLYLKSSITADEPADVEVYRRENPEFPQQPTSDQFFSESQFESYRRLGLHVARTTFDHIQSAQSNSLHEVFARMKAQWLLPPPVPVGAYTKHGEAYVDMLKTLADSSSKLDLDKVAIGDMPEWAKKDDDGRRKFFFYLQLLQLIEDVFVDLELGSAYRWNHPATAGWKQVIEHWAGQPKMKDVWEKQKDNYGQPFRDCFNDLVKMPKSNPVPEDEQQ